MSMKGKIPWNKGKGKGWIDNRGYQRIYVVENGKGRYKLEHRHVMEIKLGRKLLPEELVHHLDGNKLNNAPDNLELKNWGEHTADHHTGAKRSKYTKDTIAAMANYREELKRQKELVNELLEALELAYKAMSDSEDADGFDPKVFAKIESAINKAKGL